MPKDRFKANNDRKRMREHGFEPAKAKIPVVPHEAAAALRAMGYRVKTTNNPAVDAHVKEIAGFALERTVKALAGEIVDDKEASATLKAAQLLREEMCDPVEKVTKMTGGLTLEQIVGAATAPKKEGPTE